MEYIKTEEFLKQPVEVQKVLLEWWKPSIGDLYSFINVLGDRMNDSIFKTGKAQWVEKYKGLDYIPLLSEGQLRQFIEDNLKEKVELEWSNDGYIVNIVSTINDEKVLREFFTSQNEPIQAYWKVALQIAKE